MVAAVSAVNANQDKRVTPTVFAKKEMHARRVAPEKNADLTAVAGSAVFAIRINNARRVPALTQIHANRIAMEKHVALTTAVEPVVRANQMKYARLAHAKSRTALRTALINHVVMTDAVARVAHVTQHSSATVRGSA